MSHPPPILRPARPDDAQVLGALAAQVFLDTYATAGIRPVLVREVQQAFGSHAMAALVARATGGLWVAEHQEHLLGFVQFAPGARHAVVDAWASDRAVLPTAEIERLYVLRHFHGQGLGKALMAAAAEAARHAGCTRLWLTAWVGNAHARAWYGRQGWRDIGATPYIFKSDGFEGESFENRVLVKDA
jgi:GNAT superfamily N-acetyltransferase